MTPVVVPTTDPPGEFATLDQLATLLGKAGAADLTTEEAALGALLLTLASGLIIDAVGKDEAWAIALGPIPSVLRAVCLAAAKRVMDNPTGVRSQSETLGQHSYSSSYTDGAHGLMLTDYETTLVRRAVIGRLSGSATVCSLATEMADRYEIDGWIA